MVVVTAVVVVEVEDFPSRLDDWIWTRVEEEKAVGMVVENLMDLMDLMY